MRLLQVSGHVRSVGRGSGGLFPTFSYVASLSNLAADVHTKHLKEMEVLESERQDLVLKNIPVLL